MKFIVSAAAVMAALFTSVAVAAPAPSDGIEVDVIPHGNDVVLDLAGFPHYVVNVDE